MYEHFIQWRQQIPKPKKKGFFLLCTLLLLAIALSNIPAALHVSSRVGDRELPIYCVQTDKKLISLSFDAAWGDTCLRHKKRQ